VAPLVAAEPVDVLLALASLVVLGVVVPLLEVRLGGRGGGDANDGKGAEHDGEGHQRLHWYFSPNIKTKLKLADEKQKKRPAIP
jgi:hypothetical protein